MVAGAAAEGAGEESEVPGVLLPPGKGSQGLCPGQVGWRKALLEAGAPSDNYIGTWKLAWKSSVLPRLDFLARELEGDLGLGGWEYSSREQG